MSVLDSQMTVARRFAQDSDGMIQLRAPTVLGVEDTNN